MTQWFTAQAIFSHDSGLPEDAVVNVWHYMASGSTDRGTLALDFNAQLDSFYTTVSAYLSDDYDWNAGLVKHIDFTDDKPRLPFTTTTVSAGAGSSSKNRLPSEVAICLSFQKTAVSGENQRRMRGRIYLGPLMFDAGDYMGMATGIADFIAGAADTAFFGGSSLTTLAVYSPYTHHTVPVGEDIKDHPDEVPDALPASFHAVDKLWVDNAWDIQRRRGLKATYRKTYES